MGFWGRARGVLPVSLLEACAPRVLLWLCAISLTATINGCTLDNRHDLLDQWQHEQQAGLNEFRNGNFSNAAEHYRRAVELGAKFGRSDSHLAMAQVDLAKALASAGDYKQAESLYDSAVQELEKNTAQLDDRNLEVLGDALVGLATTSEKLALNDTDAKYRRALQFVTKQKLGSQISLVTLASERYLRSLGKSQDADVLKSQTIDAVSAATPLPSGDDQARYEVDVHRRAAQIAAKAKNWPTAENEYKQCTLAADKLKDGVVGANIATEVGEMYFEQGRFNEAAHAFRVALRQYDQVRAPSIVCRNASCGLINSFLRLGRAAEAAPLAVQLVSDSRDIKSKDKHELLEALNTLAAVENAAGDNHAAANATEEAYELTRSVDTVCSTNCSLNLCYAANQYWLCGNRKKLNSLLAAYRADALKCPDNQRLFAARMINDYAEVAAKSQHEQLASILGKLSHDLVLDLSGNTKELARSKKLIHGSV